MDTRTGKIYTQQQVEAMDSETQNYMRPMVVAPTLAQRVRRKVGRNESCPCGSGKKFKKCCLWRAGR
jgi:uncharacterized protein YecA (UPF0149 family)